MKFKHVFIVTYGRTGSTLLQGLLNNIEGCVVRGENFNLCYGLFKSYQSVNKVIKEQEKNGDSPTKPFYGSHFLNKNEFKRAAYDIVKNQLGIDFESNVKCWGFKEVRYTPANLKGEEGYELASYLDFLCCTFPKAAFIILTRDHDAVTKSGFWKTSNRQKVLSEITRFENIAIEWAKGKDNVYFIDYSNITSTDNKLKDLYQFLGAVYDEDNVIRVLNVEHSYGNKKENIISEKDLNRNIEDDSSEGLIKKKINSEDRKMHTYLALGMAEKKNDKERPFIIWTLRRSGGTNFGEALFKASSCPAVQHEPFNPDRVFGEVTKKWILNKNHEELYQSLDLILKNKPLIKHCFEIVPEEINRALIEVSVKYGYRHLILYRAYPTDRLLSLNYALKTGVWGKEQKENTVVAKDVFSSPVDVNSLIQHEYDSRKRIKEIHNVLVEKDVDPISVTFESLYTGVYEYSKSLVLSTFDALSIEDGRPDEKSLKKMLRGGAQGTKDEYLAFPGSDKLVEEANKIEKLVLISTPKYIFNTSALAKDLDFFEVWNLAPGIKSNYVYFSGVIFCRRLSELKIYLDLEDGSRIDFLMGLESPRIAEIFNHEGSSRYSRFLSKPFKAQSGTLCLESEGETKELGTLEILRSTSS